MRVYEFAKLQDVTSKEVLTALEGGGFEVANHMAVLEPKALKFLEKTFTKKGKKIYEWSIYIPDEEIQSNGQYQYKILTKLHPDERQDPQAKFLDDTFVRSFTIGADEFDTFVLGAMAELSDDGTASENITYKKVMELITNIRESLNRQK